MQKMVLGMGADSSVLRLRVGMADGTRRIFKQPAIAS